MEATKGEAMTATMKKARSQQRTQFLNDLLVDAIEGGMTTQWAEYVSIERDDDRNIIKAVLRDETDPVGDTPRDWTVSIDTMAHGLSLHTKEAKFIEQGWGTREGNGLTVANRTNGEDGDYDAIDADAILQVGLFGKVVYG